MPVQTPKTSPAETEKQGAQPEKKNARVKPFWLTRFRRQMEQHMFRKHNGTFVLYVVLRLIVLAILVRRMLQRDYEAAMLCGLVLLLFLMPSFLERKLRITFPSTMEKIILLFAFAAEILGEIGEYYILFPWWDTMLHTLNGFLCAAIGFALVDILNENPNIKFQLSPFYMAAMAFCFSMTVGVLWEFFEFGADRLLLFDMQKDTVVHTISTVMLDPTGGNSPRVLSGITEVIVNGEPLGLGGYLDIGLYDTMKDLFVNFVGAVVFCFIGYFFVSSRGKNRFARQFIPVRSERSAAGEEDGAPAGESAAQPQRAVWKKNSAEKT